MDKEGTHLCDPSRVSNVPSQLSICFGAWTMAVGCMQSSIVGVPRRSHGKSAFTTRELISAHWLPGTLQLPGYCQASGHKVSGRSPTRIPPAAWLCIVS